MLDYQLQFDEIFPVNDLSLTIELAQEVLELCTEFRDKGVCGIDMAGHENLTHIDPTPKEIIDVFKVRWHRVLLTYLSVWEGTDQPIEMKQPMQYIQWHVKKFTISPVFVVKSSSAKCI